MKKAVRDGFNPFKTRGIDMSVAIRLGELGGISKEELFQDWRQRVLSDTTDWGLCPTCAKAFPKAHTPANKLKTPRKKVSSAPSEKSQENVRPATKRKFWQFWK
jgi:hypothetical protein